MAAGQQEQRRIVGSGPGGGVLETLFLSFHLRRARQAGGALAAQAYEAVVRSAVRGSLTSIFQDDLPGVRRVGAVDLSVRNHSTVAKILRLLLAGDLGRHRLGFRPVGDGGQDATALLVMDGVGHAGVLARARVAFRLIVVIHQNFEPDYYADAYQGRWDRPLMVRAGRRAERLCARHADLNLFITPEDHGRYRTFVGEEKGSSAVLGAFQECPPLGEPTPRTGSRVRVAITGGLAERKGVLGLLDFLEVCRARRAELAPGIQLVVAGRGAPPEIRSRADGEFIVLHDSPPAIDPIVRSCDVYLNPNFTGSGIKIRNFDGLRNGLPVLCRTENAAGFRDLPARVFTTFTSSGEGVDLLLRLRADQLRSARLREEVWSEYAARFSIETGVGRFRDLLVAHGMERWARR